MDLITGFLVVMAGALGVLLDRVWHRRAFAEVRRELYRLHGQVTDLKSEADLLRAEVPASTLAMRVLVDAHGANVYRVTPGMEGYEGGDLRYFSDPYRRRFKRGSGLTAVEAILDMQMAPDEEVS